MLNYISKHKYNKTGVLQSYVCYILAEEFNLTKMDGFDIYWTRRIIKEDAKTAEK